MYLHHFVPWNLLLLAHLCSAYHDTSNVLYHCWPINADSSTATVDCQGLSLEWVGGAPPERINRGQLFNISYRARVDPEFYTQSLVFPSHNETFVREFCGQICSDRVGDINSNTCCVWHANVHTCHPSLSSPQCNSTPRVCGPWVAYDGVLSTHTAAQYGPLNQTFTSVNVHVDFEGVNVIIAHLKIGNIQLVIGQEILIMSSGECGDGVCASEVGETCQTCIVDCCPQQPTPTTTTLGVTLGISVPVVLLSLSTVALVALYYVHKRKMFFDESWIISYDHLQHRVPNDSRSRSNSTNTGGRTRHMSLEPTRKLSQESANTRTLHDFNISTITFTDIGIHEGQVVAVKMIRRRSIALTNNVRKEVLQIRVLDHPNICKFVGATLGDPTKQAIVTEYCPKGSLRDVLINKDISLNWGFRFSFVLDIARAMSYLHQKRIYHTRLTSNNCLIDNRWTVKITDFGLPTLRSTVATPRHNKSGSLSNLYRLKKRSASTEFLSPNFPNQALRIYQPPEIRDDPLDALVPRPSTDVYSFGVLLVEVATRIDLCTMDESNLSSNLKPVIRLSDLTSSEAPCPCPLDYLDLIKRCWYQPAFRRPTFELVKKTLSQINPHKESPVDMMMAMMEKYSKHLEALVAERTYELELERNKTSSVLHSMLPKTVANDLIYGKPAPATSFQSATIFFSDIVGFTKLASSSTPMEIVTFLNELYTVFDNILDHFNVYKVETIGDAYMVVSGVPSENGDRHAGEIASMALELLAASQQFRIPHRPEMRLEIRAGVHTGPVCAGVVGMKMPRYCLFGDTVNTASRMESTSEAMKIQCSSETYELLMKLGGFHLESRGSISVKGKGLMNTWWIMGKLSTQQVNMIFE